MHGKVKSWLTRMAIVSAGVVLAVSVSSQSWAQRVPSGGVGIQPYLDREQEVYSSTMKQFDQLEKNPNCCDRQRQLEEEFHQRRLDQIARKYSDPLRKYWKKVPHTPVRDNLPNGTLPRRYRKNNSPYSKYRKHGGYKHV